MFENDWPIELVGLVEEIDRILHKNGQVFFSHNRWSQKHYNGVPWPLRYIYIDGRLLHVWFYDPGEPVIEIFKFINSEVTPVFSVPISDPKCFDKLDSFLFNKHLDV